MYFDRVIPDRGRVVYNQATQVLFAVLAFFGTQVYKRGGRSIGVAWAGVRDLAHHFRDDRVGTVLAGCPPVGGLSRNYTVFLWILVTLMPLSAAVLTGLYFTYSQDVERVEGALERRRAKALRTSAGARVGASAQIDAGSESI